MLIFLNALCIVLVFFIGADVFSLADEIAYCRIKDIDIQIMKYLKHFIILLCFIMPAGKNLG